MRRRSSSCAKTRRDEELGARALGFGLPALGEVEVRADDADDRTAGLAPDRDSRATARGRSGRPCGGAGTRPRRSRAPRATLSLTSCARAHVVGMQQPLPGADVRLDLVVGVAEHLLPSRRVHDVAGVEVPVPHAFLRAGEGQRQPLFALAQRRLGALALGEVEMRADDAHDRSAGFAADRNPRESTSM